MRQTYFCPNCRALIARGDRFCGNCGTNLKWVVLQMPPRSSALSHGYQYPNRQHWGQQRLPYDQQARRNEPPYYNQTPVQGNTNQCQQQHIYRDRGNTPQKTSSSVGGTGTSISNEISKMLADFFDKHIQYN